MKKLLFIALTFFCGTVVYSQDSASVRFYVKGSETFYIQYNNNTLPLNNVHKMPVGESNLRIWSPKYLETQSKIVVPDTNPMKFYAELKPDPEYWAYLVKKERYDRKVFTGKTLPAMIGTLGTVAAPIFLVTTRNKHEEVVKSEFLAQFALSENTANERRSEYNLNRTLLTTSAALAVGGWLTYFILRKKVNNIEKPVYKQQNPFTLEYFEISMNQMNNAPQVGLTLNF